MEQRHVESVEGSPTPPNIFQPHMPGVHVLSDMDALFRGAREQLRAEEPSLTEGVRPQRAVAIVTPRREVIFELTPPRGSLPKSMTAPLEEMWSSETPLNFCVVS